MKTIETGTWTILLLSVFTAFSFAGERQTEQWKAPETKSAAKVTFVELGSVSCVPCKMMQTVMSDIEKEYGDKVDVVFYDVWTQAGKPYAKQYGIQAIPTQVFLGKDGKEFFRHLGFFPREDIEKVLEKQGIQRSVTQENPAPQKKEVDAKLQSGQTCK